jgi:hypothetical protein
MENPKGKDGHWKKHPIWHSACNETPVYADLLGTGKKVLVMGFQPPGKETEGQMAYFEPNPKDPYAPWVMHPISEPSAPGKEIPGTRKFSHGLGVGDLSGDGKNDVMCTDGWWEQPEKADGSTPWTFHPAKLGAACADMFAYDVDGDGLTDVVSSANSHGYGLAWYKQGPKDPMTQLPTFSQQMIMNTPSAQDLAMYNNVAVSQLHSLVLDDMDGDGLKDIVTGKTWLAHPYPTGDAGNMDPVLLYVFQLVRTPTAHFVPHLIDGDTPPGSGCGGAREFKVIDINKDGIKDIVIANKRGLAVFLGKP